jgi:hypothetical protein
MPDLIRHPGGEVAGYRLSPVWIQNAIFEEIPVLDKFCPEKTGVFSYTPVLYIEIY